MVAGARKAASIMGAWPPDTDRSMGNYRMGRGLEAEPLVVFIEALQPPLWS